MKVLLTDVLMCVPSKIKVNIGDYRSGDHRYDLDIATASVWNDCVDQMQDNLTRLVKQMNVEQSRIDKTKNEEDACKEWKGLSTCDPDYQIWKMKQSEKPSNET